MILFGSCSIQCWQLKKEIVPAPCVIPLKPITKLVCLIHMFSILCWMPLSIACVWHLFAMLDEERNLEKLEIQIFNDSTGCPHSDILCRTAFDCGVMWSQGSGGIRSPGTPNENSHMRFFVEFQKFS